MAIYQFNPQGVCSQIMAVELDGDKIERFEVLGGCGGNLQGLRAMITGEKASDVIEKLEGIQCGRRGTSCPDQLAKGLRDALAKELAAQE